MTSVPHSCCLCNIQINIGGSLLSFVKIMNSSLILSSRSEKYLRIYQIIKRFALLVNVTQLDSNTIYFKTKRKLKYKFCFPAYGVMTVDR